MESRSPDRTKDRLRELIADHDMTATELSRAIGRGKDYIRDFLTGRKESLGAADIAAIEVALGMPPGSFIAPRKPRLVSSFDPDEPEPVEGKDEASKSAIGKGHRLTPGAIAEIDVRAGAGGGGFATVHAVSDGSVTYAGDAVRAEWILPQSFVRDELHLSFGRTEIIPIRGDSMEPDLKDGDRVIVDRTDVNLRQGGIFAVLDAGELIVKQVELVRGSEPPQIICKSRNPNYSPIALTLDEGTAVIGRVAAKISRM